MIEPFNWWIAIILFLTYIVIDYLYAVYYIYVGKRAAIKAGIVAAFMYVLLSYGVIAYTKNPWYIVSIALGSFLGTYIAVKFFPEKVSKNEQQ
jgi:hypothetical protein